MTRQPLPLLALLPLLACSNRNDQVPIDPIPSFDVPTEWNAREARIAMRLTNASSTSTEVRRALGVLFNGDPLDPDARGIDPAQLLMRGAAKLPDGGWAPAQPGTEAELLGGTSVDQAQAWADRVRGGDAFSLDEAVDACGNPMLMTLLTPEALDDVLPGAQDLPVWPSTCADASCAPEFGSWDVALGERNFDGMIDMVINVLPSVAVDPVQPGVWGQLTALFLTGDNPGTSMLPLFANMRRVQVNLTNVWQLDDEYVDPAGLREVYRFPHRPRTLTQSDVFVFMEGHGDAQDVWDAAGLGETRLPAGMDAAAPVGVDYSGQAGLDLINAGADPDRLTGLLNDLIVHQVSAALACPGVREPAWIRQGPIEFFLCPDGDIDTCIAREDMAEGACLFPTEPEPELFDPFPVTFDRYDTTAGVVQVPAGDMPVYLSDLGGTPAEVQLEVTDESAVFVYGPRILSARTAAGVTVQLPEPSDNDHCAQTGMSRYDLGAAWGAGTYVLTVDPSAALGGPPASDPETGENLTWFYFTSLDAWTR